MFSNLAKCWEPGNDWQTCPWKRFSNNTPGTNVKKTGKSYPWFSRTTYSGYFKCVESRNILPMHATQDCSAAACCYDNFVGELIFCSDSHSIHTFSPIPPTKTEFISFSYRNLFVTNETFKRMHLSMARTRKLRCSPHMLVLNPKTRADVALDFTNSFDEPSLQCVKQSSHLVVFEIRRWKSNLSKKQQR